MIKAQHEARILQNYHELIEKSREEFKKEMQSLMPEAKIGKKGRIIINQWTLVITNSLGPVKLLCYIKILLYPVAKTIKYKEILNYGTKKNYFVTADFVTGVSVLYNKSPLYHSSYIVT